MVFGLLDFPEFGRVNSLVVLTARRLEIGSELLVKSLIGIPSESDIAGRRVISAQMASNRVDHMHFLACKREVVLICLDIVGHSGLCKLVEGRTNEVDLCNAGRFEFILVEAGMHGSGRHLSLVFLSNANFREERSAQVKKC